MARLTTDNLERARSLIGLYPHKRSALVPMLHLVQEQEGYLSAEAIEQVAELLDLTPAEVRGTASFYEMFHLEPVGRYLVAVCTNIACMLSGAYELLEHIESSLGARPGTTTPDGLFTLEEAECLALCGNAPCLTVNWRFFGDVGPEQWDALADDLREGRLDGEVPPHGTLCRVGRSVGLLAAGGDGATRAGGGGTGLPEAAARASGPPAGPPSQAGSEARQRDRRGRSRAGGSLEATRAAVARAVATEGGSRPEVAATATAMAPVTSAGSPGEHGATSGGGGAVSLATVRTTAAVASTVLDNAGAAGGARAAGGSSGNGGGEGAA
ncbi:MAG TPA: NAD(P)H-dependent oxidoreductase subunit E [Acidimicrobiales bacterium]|nr:NAD(P)H-dependent oxidoreductase subunit E [Acidimicrobiales bacterium]